MADDSDLWRRAMRDVAPLPGRAMPPERQADRGRPARIASETPTVPIKRLAPLPALDRRAGIDRATAERLRRGRYPVDGVLDLHGMTQEEAHTALSRRIAAARAAGQRVLLVVTGHGRMSGGILKAAVPRWLDEPELRRQVLMIAPARPQDGGGGALYVLLRRTERP
jgi:DNA-nicking Smr family endonuclease